MTAPTPVDLGDANARHSWLTLVSAQLQDLIAAALDATAPPSDRMLGRRSAHEIIGAASKVVQDMLVAVGVRIDPLGVKLGPARQPSSLAMPYRGVYEAHRAAPEPERYEGPTPLEELPLDPETEGLAARFYELTLEVRTQGDRIVAALERFGALRQIKAGLDAAPTTPPPGPANDSDTAG